MILVSFESFSSSNSNCRFHWRHHSIQLDMQNIKKKQKPPMPWNLMRILMIFTCIHCNLQFASHWNWYFWCINKTNKCDKGNGKCVENTNVGHFVGSKMYFEMHDACVCVCACKLLSWMKCEMSVDKISNIWLDTTNNRHVRKIRVPRANDKTILFASLVFFMNTYNLYYESSVDCALTDINHWRHRRRAFRRHQ